MAGDLMAGLMLSQIIYWYLPDKRGRSKLRVQKHGYMWLVKTRDDWWTEIRLTARQADRALKILRDKGLITTSLHRFNGAPTTHIRLNKAAFLAAWNEAVVTDYPNLPNGEFTNPLNQTGGNSPNGNMELPDSVNSLTETTAETTSSKTTDSAEGATAPPDPPKQKRRTSQRKTKTPPAVQVFRQNAHRFPAKSWYSNVSEAVGEDEVDLEFWGKVVKGWVGCGWNPTNVQGMLEFYQRREIPTTNGSGHRAGNYRAPPAPRTADDYAEGDEVL
jgi:hypothetical protein